MKLGPLSIAWERLTESERIDMGLDPWPGGWEALSVEWNHHGIMILARPLPWSRVTTKETRK